MLSYLLQMIACSAVLYGYYHLFLRNERFHQYNRFYLLLAVVASLILPLLKIPVEINATPENPLYTFVKTEETVVVGGSSDFDWKMLVYPLYTAVITLLFIRLILAIYKIIHIRQLGTYENISQIKLIRTSHPQAPFSFFNWLFWNVDADTNSAEGKQILQHELYHIRSKHSWDGLFIELVLCLYWFNPLFYLYRRELKAIQEFLADKYATVNQNTHDYAELLVMQALGSQHIRFAHPFFNNFLKRRIAMLITPKKNSHQWVKQLLVIPVFTVTASLLIVQCKPSDKNADEPTVSIQETVQTPEPPANVASEKSDSKTPSPLPDSENPVFKNSKGEIISGPEVFSKVEVDAKYPGNWRNYLMKNLDPQIPIDHQAPPGNYTTITQFIVDTKGNVSDIKALTHHGYGMEEEAMRVIKLSGKWAPAIQNGKVVKAFRKQPITFQVTEG